MKNKVPNYADVHDSGDEEEITQDQKQQSQPASEPTSTNFKSIGVNQKLAEAKNANAFLDALATMNNDEVLPWEVVTLPSRGIYYQGTMPDGAVKVRPFDIEAEKIMSTARLLQSGEAIDYLIAKYTRLPDGINHQDLLVGDKTFLLYYLRGITYGNEYEFMGKCESCGQSTTAVYDMNNLISTMKGPSPDHQQEPIMCRLPYLSEKSGRDVSVGLRLMRGADLTVMIKKSKQKTRDAIDQTISDNLASLIVGFQVGNSYANDAFKTRQIIGKLHLRDTSAIRNMLDEITPGIEDNIDFVCSKCGHESKVTLPISETFFRPKSNKAPRIG